MVSALEVSLHILSLIKPDKYGYICKVTSELECLLTLCQAAHVVKYGEPLFTANTKGRTRKAYPIPSESITQHIGYPDIRLYYGYEVGLSWRIHKKSYLAMRNLVGRGRLSRNQKHLIYDVVNHASVPINGTFLLMDEDRILQGDYSPINKVLAAADNRSRVALRKGLIIGLILQLPCMFAILHYLNLSPNLYTACFLGYVVFAAIVVQFINARLRIK